MMCYGIFRKTPNVSLLSCLFSQKLRKIISSCLRCCSGKGLGAAIRQRKAKIPSQTSLPILRVTFLFGVGIPGSGKSSLFGGITRVIKERGGLGTDWNPMNPYIVIRTKQLERWLSHGADHDFLKTGKRTKIMVYPAVKSSRSIPIEWTCFEGHIPIPSNVSSTHAGSLFFNSECSTKYDYVCYMSSDNYTAAVGIWLVTQLFCPISS